MDGIDALKKQMDSLLKDITPNLTKQFEEAKAQMKALVKPIEEKAVKVNGINCVAQLYADGVKIIIPDAKDYFDSLTYVKKESLFKRIINKFKWQ